MGLRRPLAESCRCTLLEYSLYHRVNVDLARSQSSVLSEDDLLWTAPEILRESPNVNYQVADIYSFAVIIAEILNNAKAFSEMGMEPEGQ